MRIVERHPLWLRCLHWLNVPLLAVMVWSGVLIYWANDIYPGFFPEWFYDGLGVDHHLADGMGLHFTFGWFFVGNALLYLTVSIATGHWKGILPGRRELRDLFPSVLLEMGLGKWVSRRPPATPGYSPAQRMAYTSVVVLAGVEILSGFAIYKPVQLRWLKGMFWSYEGARLVHFGAMVLLVLFVGVHVLQVIRAGWNTFRSMVAGFEREGESGP